MGAQRITPTFSDWLLVLAVLFLALVGLAMLDEYNRIEADTAANLARGQAVAKERP